MAQTESTGVERIARAFALAQARGSCALMPFVTGGFPSIEDTEHLLRELPNAGADLIEVGIPFSDPIADGPVIAASMHEALLRGVTPRDVLGCIRRAESVAPVLVMVSVSIIERMGVESFLVMAEESGVAGLIVPDAGPEFWLDARRMARAVTERLGVVELVAPSTPRDRLERIVQEANAFIYLLARAGITGERSDAPEVAARVAEIRTIRDVRIAVGFGVSTAAHVSAVGMHADGAIVGSAIVRAMDEAARSGNSATEAALRLVRTLR
jgi:tryptophan synthase alpha chain